MNRYRTAILLITAATMTASAVAVSAQLGDGTSSAAPAGQAQQVHQRTEAACPKADEWAHEFYAATNDHDRQIANIWWWHEIRECERAARPVVRS